MIEEFAAWRKETLFTGAIVQDEDSTVEGAEAARRCRRYVALVEQVEGSEGQEVFQTLIDSMRVKEGRPPGEGSGPRR